MEVDTKHTAEPWVYSQSGEDDNWGIILNGGEMPSGQSARLLVEIARINLTVDGGEQNGRRIVACVNACAGIDPAAVPDLLAALVDIVETIEEGHADGGLVVEPKLHAARAALAKARTGG